ncbi:MAG: UvrD-helicase domain-containing protein [Firmicutes bacterium]|nr:UvrD-helicase domain-containing protein [Bacillota bacterium]
MEITKEKQFLAARRSYIASHFSDLNERQLEAVLTTEGPLLLLAGAGSGKTTVLIHRIANLIRFGRASDASEIPEYIEAEDVDFLENLPAELSDSQRQRADYLCALEPAAPWSILAITFTNKAAGELKERLIGMLGPEAQDIWAMTFHAACCRILRRNIEKLGYTKHFTIYDTADSERLMKEVLREMGLDDKTFPPKYVLNIISREKDSMVLPEELAQTAQEQNDLKMLPIARAYKRYQARLKENDALDFDDIILLTVQLLQSDEQVRAYYQRKFRYVLVDEYQDTNHLQYLLAALLAGGRENLCVVGDDDQSIYRFRGATIANILDFEKQYPAARTIRLEQNYRSTQAILNAANAVITNNTGRKGKHLWTSNGSGKPITVYEAPDERAEANFVAGQILALSKTAAFRDCAVLYRTNAQSNAVEFALKRNGIPYRVIGGTRFFDRAEIKDMLSYLCVIHNPSDNLRLKRIINNPPRGLGAKSIETAERLAQAEGVPLYQVVSHPENYAPLEKSAAKFRAFASIVASMQQLLADGMSLPDFYEELLRRTGYVTMLEAKPDMENLGRLENVKELKSSIENFVKSAEEPTLAAFLEEIALYTDIEEYNASDDAAVLMTMHSSKGLEFPHVFLVGFEDGLFPGMRAIGDREEMEEERRLCYVAITRAKKTLTISHARQRMLYGRTNAALPSRFLKELPAGEIVRRGGYAAEGGYRAEPIRHEAQKPRTAAHHTLSSTPSGGSHAPCLELSKGDMVEHSAFGRGLVLSVLKLSGDALLEVAFDKVGTKKLMAKTASAYMKKVQ